MVWRPPVLDRARDDDHNWRVRLPPGSRLTIVTRIAETIDRCISFSVPVNELRRIAARFEERVYRNAVDQIDYLRIIATRMVIMETKYLSSADSCAPSKS
ncbi:PREDICTED: mediator of RNA polymerase II transcription subunit 15a isoform X1 [Tarenaya hassleriana]|uniref:mediator of RNA polymerase II transcription subunit 15a isoform X1 n=1 Tax=Tarenaya hassleriana TaxID=28532 RepID=UPI00053C18EA|nr:PREDICTED: mediator of RNA polymerase II transcription subunit 15a isoform X1 [Tarenaya hassleriana]